MKKKRTTFRLAALLFAVLMALSLFGCGQKKPEAQESISLAVVTETPTADPTEAARPTETPTAEPTESAKPTEAAKPTETPTAKPTETVKPTEAPTQKPTETPEPTAEPTEAPEEEEDLLDPDGTYTSKEDVALYLYQYGELPQNFMTKKEAKKLGWSGGGLDDYAYGYCIGGDRYGNYEGNLPDGNYHECDIDTLHKKKRGAKRIVYSDDGRIYYTDDHYATFTLLYGEE